MQEVWGEKKADRDGPAAFTQFIASWSWETTSPLFPAWSVYKTAVTAPWSSLSIWSINNTSSVYRNICSSQCYRSLQLISSSHFFFCSTLSTQSPILIMKRIAACITVVLFDNIFHVQEGLLKLSSLTSHTVQAFYSYRVILTTNLNSRAIKNICICSRARMPRYQTHNKGSLKNL